MLEKKGREQIRAWFTKKKWKIFPFQEETWDAIAKNKQGIVNAPTGSGKTYALSLGVLEQYLNHRETSIWNQGVQLIWISPIKALAKEIEDSIRQACEDLEIPWSVARRTGDTSPNERQKQVKEMPNVLITTPESLQLLFATKGHEKRFMNLKCIVNDEWHELLGSKRAVQMELAHSRLKAINPKLLIWGISATIGNIEEALRVLLGTKNEAGNSLIIQAKNKKEIEHITLLPDEMESLPWSGHLGIRMLSAVIPVIENSKSTLLFTNTRAQAEIWYQKILEEKPELAGLIAMHHGSINRELRDWVEDALHQGKLKVVVCTSSLDLGVDFRPVESIIQIGSPKGVSRFMQRAGRSGHQPGAKSKIYFLPTHGLEIIESLALKKAVENEMVEDRIPYIRSFDVLAQYLMTLAVSDGFYPDNIFKEVITSYSFSTIQKEEWDWILQFLVKGGQSLEHYEEFHKIQIDENGLFKVFDRKIAMRHRLSIGTIVSEPFIHVCFVSGKSIGTVEEYFISRLNPGDVFWFSGRSLEFVQLKGTKALVRLSKQKTGKVPSWQGGRMPLSSQLSRVLREEIINTHNDLNSREALKLKNLLSLQAERSIVPKPDQFLIEYFKGKDGYHAYFYPFEGRFVHEGMAAIIAYRIGLIKPISFSIALNDYGFELLSDQEIPIQEAIDNMIFTADALEEDIAASINSNEMARRKFRDIANIAGLIFRGYPGKNKKDKHLQASSQLFYEVFSDYENDNLFFLQAHQEVRDFQLEELRMRNAFKRIEKQEIIVKRLEKPSPFSFPIMVDGLREKMSFEKLEDRIHKMQLEYSN